MRTYSTLLFCIAFSLYSIQNCYSQSNFIGTWEGIFMNDFKALINFSLNNQNQFKGNIKMFAGENIIQDDKLENIKLLDNKLTFYIPAKETLFEGSFNDQVSGLSGAFVFPDGSKHAIELNRKTDELNPFDEFKLLKTKPFDAKVLRSDLLFLYNSLNENHPQLYTFSSKDSIAALVEKLSSNINSSLTVEDFYLIASKLTNAVKCSHTGVRLPSPYHQSIKTYGNFFPLRLFFANGKAYYISGKVKGDILMSPGNEIVSINNMPVKQIISRLFSFIPSEGCNTTTKYNELNRRFNEFFYFIDDSTNFLVKFKRDLSIESLSVPSSSLTEINMNFDMDENNELVTFNYINNMSIGVLKVRSFAIKKMDSYFQKLDSIFSDLKSTKTNDLIIDLRDNSGGHPIFAAQLLSYLTHKDFIYFKRNEEVKDFEPLYNKMPPNKLNFDGNIYVFINGGCLSTTGHLISLLKFHTDAIFLGEEPGSTFRCNDFSMQLNLPNTGILLNVPRTTFETSVSGFNLCEPFSIDYKVNKTPSNIISKNDAYLETFNSIIDK